MPSRKNAQKAQKKSPLLSLKQKVSAATAVLFGFVLVYSAHYASFNHYLFNANLLDNPAPFDGTVYPVAQVPNWVMWKGDNHIDPFSSLTPSMLIDLPHYDIESLQTPLEELDFKTKEDRDIRNAQLTYSVVYLGNYKLDHKENSGSHLAVDIRMPMGTEVVSIANGRVVKVSMTEDGFGHHVVIEHPDVPDPDNASKKTTLYSAYNHMGDIFVKEGDVVTKGQLIGKSGNTGTTTTPHLHFQIDKQSAPWHPYWPFTWAESQEAGLSFFEAVNAGLGLQIAKEYTINPMVYVQSHLSQGSIPAPKENKPVPPKNTPEPPKNKPQEPKIEVSEPEIGEGLEFSEAAVSEGISEEAHEDYSHSLPGTKSESTASEPAKNNSPDFFTDVPLSNPHYKAIKALQEEGVITGYPNGTFEPNKAVDRVEALKMLMLAFDIEAEDERELPFSDTDDEAWYAETLATAVNKAIVKGYEDGTFKPAQIVNKAEYLKMLFETNEIEPKVELNSNPYKDVPAEAWYAGYAYLTNKQNLLDVINNQLNPDKGMTRGDVAESIYRMKYLLENDLISYAK